MKESSFRITPEKFDVKVNDGNLIFSEKPLKGACPPIHEEAMTQGEGARLTKRRHERDTNIRARREVPPEQVG